jgi:hypothetical protein
MSKNRREAAVSRRFFVDIAPFGPVDIRCALDMCRAPDMPCRREGERYHIEFGGAEYIEVPKGLYRAAAGRISMSCRTDRTFGQIRRRKFLIFHLAFPSFFATMMVEKKKGGKSYEV